MQRLRNLTPVHKIAVQVLIWWLAFASLCLAGIFSQRNGDPTLFIFSAIGLYISGPFALSQLFNELRESYAGVPYDKNINGWVFTASALIGLLILAFSY